MNRTMTFLLAASMGLSTIACGQEKSIHNHGNLDQAASENNEKIEASLSISNKQVQQILLAYLEIKDNLVMTNGPAVSESAKAFLTLVENNDDQLIKDLAFDAEHIMDTKDTGHQRDHFNTLSDNVYSLIKRTSANESIVYRQYCPMALNNTGAYWLSAGKEVNNPYFGDKMLHCGSVKETLGIKL